MLKFSNLGKLINSFTNSKKVATLRNHIKRRKRKSFIILILMLFFGVYICSYGQELRPQKGNNGKWGYVDNKGNVMIQFQYKKAREFSENLAAVRQGSKWGYIDQTGKVIIAFKYCNAKDFQNGLAAVKYNENPNSWGLIDKDGNYKTNFTYPFQETDELINLTIEKIFKENERKLKEEREKERLEREKQEKLEREKKEREEKAEQERIANLFSTFSRKYVSTKLNQWQQRGEFEKTIDWEKRVNIKTIETKKAELQKESEEAYITEQSKKMPIGNITLGRYNPDKEEYIIRNSIHGDWLESVPINEAQNFRDNWNNLVKTPKFTIINDQIAFAGYKFEKSHNIVTQNAPQQTVQNNSTGSQIDKTSQNEQLIEKKQITDTHEKANNYDIILLKNGQEIKAKVNEITLTEIKYKAFDNLAGPTRYAAKNDVLAVIYANGQREVFGATSKNTQNVSDKPDKVAFGVSPAYNIGNVVNHFGIAGKLRVNVAETFPLGVEFSYYFPEKMKIFGADMEYNAWDACLNIQPTFTKSDKMMFYAKTGLRIMGTTLTILDESKSLTLIGLDTGGGIDFKLFNEFYFNTEADIIYFFRKGDWGWRFVISTGLVIKF